MRSEEEIEKKIRELQKQHDTLDPIERLHDRYTTAQKIAILLWVLDDG